MPSLPLSVVLVDTNTIDSHPHATSADGVDAVPLVFIHDRPEQPSDSFVVDNTDSFKI